MGDWKDFPLPDGSYSDDTRPWSHQDVCNYLPTFAERGGSRSRALLKPAPGLDLFSTVGDGPHRGSRDVEGKCFVVSGNKLYQVSTGGIVTELGTIPGTARVSMTHNQVEGGNQLVIGTGDNSYVWDTSDSTLTATGVGLSSVDFLNQLVIGVEPQRRFFRYSGLADALSWNDLDNESAESSPDRIVGTIVSQGELLVFGERTIEVWQHNPTDSTQFQRTVVIEKGCANAATICRLDNSVFFLGNDFILYRLQGYTPVPVSTKAHVSAFRQSSATKAFAFTYEDHGYVIYYLTFQDGHTWGYDVTNQRFHRRESFGLDRWRLNTLFKWNGEWFGGDYSNGKLYRLDKEVMQEDGSPIPRKIRTGVLHSSENRVLIPAIRLLVNTGISGPADAPLIAGDLGDGFTGESADYTYTTAGGVPPLQNYVMVSGSGPAGLTFNTALGQWTGTRTTPGVYSWTLQRADSVGTLSNLLHDTSETLDEFTWFISMSDGLSHAYVGKFSGDTWSGVTPVGAHGRAFFLADQYHVANDSAEYRYSTNQGTSWVNLPGFWSSGGGRMVEFGGYIYACGATSPLGRRLPPSGGWVATTADTTSRANTITVHGDNLVVASIYDTRASISPDAGVTWAYGSGAWFGGAIAGNPRIASNGTRIVIAYNDAGATNTVRVKYSDDGGSTWALVYSFPNPNVADIVTDVLWNGTRFVVGTELGQVASSADGITWSLSASVLASVRQMTYGTSPGGTTRMMAVGSGGVAYTSDNHGITWTQRLDPAAANDILGVAWVYS